MDSPPSPAALRAKLSLETGRLCWSELQRHFARGAVLVVVSGLDLVEVAARIAEDDQVSVKAWIGQGRLLRATDHHARAWAQAPEAAAFRAVVVAPWVLVQDARPHQADRANPAPAGP